MSSDFEFTYTDVPGSGIVKRSNSVPISYRQYEYRLNQTKSQINVLNPEFIVRYEEEARDYYRALRKERVRSQLSIDT